IRLEPAYGWFAAVRRHADEGAAIHGATRRHEGMRDVDLRAADRLDRASHVVIILGGDAEATRHRASRALVVEFELEAHTGDGHRCGPGDIAGIDLRGLGNAYGGALQTVVVAVHRQKGPFDVPPARTPGMVALAAHLEQTRLGADRVTAAAA